MIEKKEIVAYVYNPGEYKAVISEINITGSEIRVHVLSTDNDLYEPFNFDFDVRKDELVDKTCLILGISKSMFARNFDAKELDKVAKKLNKALVGKKVQIRIRGTLLLHSQNADGNVVTEYSHKMEILI